MAIPETIGGTKGARRPWPNLTSRVGPRGCALTVALVLACTILSPTSARAEGVAWRSLSFEEAMAEAQKTGLPVFVDVWAAHCGQCGTMEDEFWPSEDAARLTEGTIPIQIRSDDPAASTFRGSYPILGLPAILLIDPEGNEIDRVTGYYGAKRFLSEAGNLFAQVDPLSEMEAQVAAEPGNVRLVLPLLEKYVDRKRTADAERLLARVLELDPRNEAKQAEKAMTTVAKYHAYFTHREDRAQEIWRRFVEELPEASSISQGLKATFEHAQASGTTEEWKTWICGILAKRPESGQLAYNVAIWGNRGHLRGGCLPEAARTAHRLNIGPAWMDSLADVLEEK